MPIAAEITLAGVPTLKVPDNWPHYDLIAQRPETANPLRISVQARTYKAGGGNFVTYKVSDEFDWLAIVLLDCEQPERRRALLVPRAESDKRARKDSPTAQKAEHSYRIDEVEKRGFRSTRTNPL